jgi:cyclohexyl-isocyanide hydratase
MNIGFLLFENVTQLDLTGPAQVLSRLPGANLMLIAKSYAPVGTDCGFGIVPTTVIGEAPQLDILCAPGGYGVDAAINDPETIAFVRDQAVGARYVTSVCTGAFILGAAKLLHGVRATTHWAYRDLLPLIGAIPEHARVVRDGRFLTGGGVTSGIDFALALAAEAVDLPTAQRIKLALEYDPAPPIAAGGAEVEAQVGAFYAGRIPKFRAALETALAR